MFYHAIYKNIQSIISILWFNTSFQLVSFSFALHLPFLVPCNWVKIPSHQAPQWPHFSILPAFPIPPTWAFGEIWNLYHDVRKWWAASVFQGYICMQQAFPFADNKTDLCKGEGGKITKWLLRIPIRIPQNLQPGVGFGTNFYCLWFAYKGEDQPKWQTNFSIKCKLWTD